MLDANVAPVRTCSLQFGQFKGMSDAVQQCVAADEAGASDGASQLNAVLDGQYETAVLCLTANDADAA